MPLQQGLSSSSIALDDKISVVILATSDTPDNIVCKAGIFYTGLQAGCSCADDPAPLPEQAEYCEIQLTIARDTAEADIALLPG